MRALLLSVCMLALSVLLYRKVSSPSPAIISNKVVLLCDASSGIGEDLAYELAKEGARMVLVTRTGRSESLLNTLKDGKLGSPQAQLQISAHTWRTLLKVRDKALALGSPQVEVLSFDFGNVTGAHTLVDKTIEMFGELDYLVMNHAEIPRGSILKTHKHQNAEYIDRTFRVNVFSFIEIAMRAMPHLEKNQGHIFVTSSTLGEVPSAEFPVFTSTKHALNGFFYSLQDDLAESQSPVTVTIGSLGEVRIENRMPMFKLPKWLIGDQGECAQGMKDSLVKRDRTFTFPIIHPYFAKFVWYFLSY